MQYNEKRQFSLPHSSVQLSANAENRVFCVCRRAQLFFYLEARERERKVSRLLTWPLGCRDQH